jgi:hypothetical protein
MNPEHSSLLLLAFPGEIWQEILLYLNLETSTSLKITCHQLIKRVKIPIQRIEDIEYHLLSMYSFQGVKIFEVTNMKFKFHFSPDLFWYLEKLKLCNIILIDKINLVEITSLHTLDIENVTAGSKKIDIIPPKNLKKCTLACCNRSNQSMEEFTLRSSNIHLNLKHCSSISL